LLEKQTMASLLLTAEEAMMARKQEVNERIVELLWENDYNDDPQIFLRSHNEMMELLSYEHLDLLDVMDHDDEENILQMSDRKSLLVIVITYLMIMWDSCRLHGDINFNFYPRDFSDVELEEQITPLRQQCVALGALLVEKMQRIPSNSVDMLRVEEGNVHLSTHGNPLIQFVLSTLTYLPGVHLILDELARIAQDFDLFMMMNSEEDDGDMTLMHVAFQTGGCEENLMHVAFQTGGCEENYGVAWIMGRMEELIQMRRDVMNVLRVHHHIVDFTVASPLSASLIEGEGQPVAGNNLFFLGNEFWTRELVTYMQPPVVVDSQDWIAFLQKETSFSRNTVLNLAITNNFSMDILNKLLDWGAKLGSNTYDPLIRYLDQTAVHLFNEEKIVAVKAWIDAHLHEIITTAAAAAA